jgi:hypothetical protein
MPLPEFLKTHYEAVLDDLKKERLDIQQNLASLNLRMRELNGSIDTLEKRINPDPFSAAGRPSQQRYANISVRWAILDLLFNSKALLTSEIAEALKAGGVQTKAANFANNVSAVLTTTMKDRHDEVRQLPDGRWELTETGRSAIEYIRTSPKFHKVFVPAPWDIQRRPST